MSSEAWALSLLPARLRFWEPPKDKGTPTTVAERIQARYVANCRKRVSTRKAMRECGVLDDWKEAWDRS